MDNLTHSLVGVAISRGFFKKRVAYATWALVIAANLPDLDVVYSWPGIRTIEYHRGVLHSIWMLPVWALLVAFGLRWFVRRHPPRRRAGMAQALSFPNFGLAFGMAAAGVGSHLVLDWTNAYGVRLLAPVSPHWYALDLMPIWDPWLWLLLIAFLGVPMLLGLISSEVGVTRRNPHRLSGILALIVLAAWIGLRSRHHAAALEQLNAPETAADFEGELPLDWGAFPSASSPFDWHAVVDLPSRVLIAEVTTPWNPDRDRFILQRSYTKPPMTARIQVAEQTPTARVFLQFARFPLADDQMDGQQWLVNITDMRFAQGVRRPSMHVGVELSSTLNVLWQRFTWGRW